MTETHEKLPACLHCQYGDRGFPCRDGDGKLRPDHLTKALLVTFQEDADTPRYDEHSWAFECMDELVTEAPETAFSIIVLALAQFGNDRGIEQLAAGPLEDIVGRHGTRMIDAIEQEAKKNERFRYLLSGIWGEPHVDPAIWRRIQVAVRKGPWMDQDPRTPQGSDEFNSEK